MTASRQNEAKDIFKKIFKTMLAIYDVQSIFIASLKEKGQGKIKILASAGIFADFVFTDNMESFILSEISKTKKMVIVDKIDMKTIFFDEELSEGVSNFILLPLKYKKQLFGVVGIVSKKSENILTIEGFSSLELFMDLVAGVLHEKMNAFTICEKQIKDLRQMVEKYFQIFYMSPNAIALLSSDEAFTEVNPSFTLISGFTKEEAIGRTMEDLGVWVNLEDREKLMKMFEEDDGTHNIELPLYRKNGEIMYAQIIVRRGTLHGQMSYLAVARDISAEVATKEKQEKQEEELKISRNKLATAATLASMGPWEYDTKTEEFEFSDELYAIYGTDSRTEGKFMRFEDYLHEFVYPEDVWMFKSEKALLNSAKVQKKIAPADMVHRIIRRDGEIRTVLVRRRFIHDAAGTMIKVYGTNQDITERIRIEEEQRKQADMIKHMAYYDSLTGLPNRNYLNEWLAKNMDNSEQDGAGGAVFLLDLDQLKMINDAYGHSFGDKIINTVGTRLKDVLGSQAFIARIGGDEFVIILRGQHTREEIESKAKKLIESISRRQEHLNVGVHITVSVGIAFYPKDGDNVEEIIKNAENAMYKAKRNGRNCCRFYNKEMQIEAYKKMRLIEGLRYAIARGELSIVYQPQINFPKGEVGGVEALLRWNSKEYGNVSPAVFIPLAEQAGFINSIGYWVLKESCFFARRLKEKGWPNLSVAVNISAMQITSVDFVDNVANAIRIAEIEPEQIEIEITESLLMTSLAEASLKLEQIKALGVKIALDDFGTGYSSLTYLCKLPFKKLKIDKSFIDMIETDDFGSRMIEAIINMAKSINMDVVAEGVETHKQLDYLLDKGCAWIQGYFFSKPLTEPEIYKFLEDFNKKQQGK